MSLNVEKSTYIAISGFFDPLHVGHIKYIDDAATFGRVIILLNSDAAAIRKKGSVFMPLMERKAILESIRNVSCVLPAQDDDGTVCESLQMLGHTLHYFGNGGDRGPMNTPEVAVCEKLGINTIYGLGGPKIQSSSDLVTHAKARR